MSHPFRDIASAKVHIFSKTKETFFIIRRKAKGGNPLSVLFRPKENFAQKNDFFSFIRAKFRIFAIE